MTTKQNLYSLLTLALLGSFIPTTTPSKQLEARQAETIQTLSSVNRAQQAYYIERNRFASRLIDLQAGIRPETLSYRYRLAGVSQTRTFITATAKLRGLKSYTGAVFITRTRGQISTLSAICETVRPSSIPPTFPRLVTGNNIICPTGSIKH